MKVITPAITDEERLVAELELLGIHYLSRQTNYHAEFTRPPADLLASLVQQPSARVRGALIAVLLAHPEFADAMREALKHRSAQEQISLCFFYTAAMLLQQMYAETIQQQLGVRWRWLPDLFSGELNLPSDGTPQERLMRLGQLQQQRTCTFVNWAGTYQDVARRLLRQWKLEKTWNL